MIDEIKEKSIQNLLARIGKKRWHKCIIFEGGYIEGDKIVIDK